MIDADKDREELRAIGRDALEQYAAAGVDLEAFEWAWFEMSARERVKWLRDFDPPIGSSAFAILERAQEKAAAIVLVKLSSPLLEELEALSKQRERLEQAAFKLRTEEAGIGRAFIALSNAFGEPRTNG